MGYLIAFVSLVAVIQGAVWLGPRRGLPWARRGAALCVVGVLGLGFGLVLVLVPGLLA